MREKYLKSGMGKRYLRNRLKRSLSLTGFTIIELMVVVAITAVLSAVVLVSTTQYIKDGKDANISANLAVLIPSGEVYYNSGGGNYSGFCDPTTTGTVLKTIIPQMPAQSTGAPCYSASVTSTTNPAGVCCNIAGLDQAWAACAREFSNTSNWYCVDSRGIRKEVTSGSCDNTITQCPS